jgi:hypothetical protein
MNCVYCQGKNRSPLTKEHIISKSVLLIALGKNEKGQANNFTKSSIFGNRTLIDHEHTVKDVCKVCNEQLSSYDVAGVNLLSEIDKFYDATGKSLTLDRLKIGWLLKTHLNFIRVLPRKKDPVGYKIEDAIYKRLKSYKQIPSSLFDFFIEGWEGEPSFWDQNENRKIQYFSYKSVEFQSPANILISNLRIKIVDTFLALPADSNYTDFHTRTKLVINSMKFNGFKPQSIPKKYKSPKIIPITNIYSQEEIKKKIREIVF